MSRRKNKGSLHGVPKKAPTVSSVAPWDMPPEPPRPVPSHRFTKGNEFWKWRSSCGEKPMFANSEQLWAACCEYFEKAQAHPLMEAKLVSYEGISSLEALPKVRAMSVHAMCLFLDISQGSWVSWRKNRPDLLAAIEKAEDVIRTQKFVSAMSGRRYGGGYSAVDPSNPETMAELRQQAADSLRQWIERYRGVCSGANLAPVEEIAAGLVRVAVAA